MVAGQSCWRASSKAHALRAPLTRRPTGFALAKLKAAANWRSNTAKPVRSNKSGSIRCTLTSGKSSALNPAYSTAATRFGVWIRLHRASFRVPLGQHHRRGREQPMQRWVETAETQQLQQVTRKAQT